MANAGGRSSGHLSGARNRSSAPVGDVRSPDYFLVANDRFVVLLVFDEQQNYYLTPERPLVNFFNQINDRSLSIAVPQ